MEIILHRREKLILTTIEIINELGIQGLSTREIAKREGVSEATIFRHFKSKSDLLIAVLQYYSQFDTDINQTVSLKNMNPLDSIKFIVKAHIEYYENYPSITALMQNFEFLRYEADLSETVKKILYSRHASIKELVEVAQLEGDMKAEIHSDKVVHMINGMILDMCLRWRIENQRFSLKEEVLTTLELLLRSLKA